MLVRLASFHEIVTAAPRWNVAGFNRLKTSRFMTWHGQLWFLLVILFYCLILPAFLAVAAMLDGPVRQHLGVIGAVSLEHFSHGLMGCSICVTLLWAFRKYGDKHSPAVRFLSDASYTVYLFHVTVIAVVGY